MATRSLAETLGHGANSRKMLNEASISISVLIPAFNERENISDCLRSVRWTDDVVVVDSGSLDGTVEIAQESGARVETFQYQPGGPKKKNWALRNVKFRYGWVFILDADERVTEELVLEMRKLFSQRQPDKVGYYINRRFFFLDRWIRHAGYYPSWNLRLLRLGYGEYEFIPDFSGENGDNEVHEHVLLRGPAGYLRTPFDHYAYPSIRVFVEKHNRYSSWESHVGSRYLRPREEHGEMAPGLRFRRTLKALARQMPCPHIARFLYHYVFKLGFLDGPQGYIFCKLLAEYEFLIWAKAIEMRRRNSSRLPAT